MNQAKLPSRQDVALANTSDIRRLEQALMQKQASFQVMQNAAAVVFDLIKKNHPDKSHHFTIHIILGSGNNAGDGLLLAARLKKAGYRVKAFSVFDKAFVGDAEKAYQVALNAGVNLATFSPFSCEQHDVIVEAIFGIGLNRGADGLAQQAIDYINHCRANLPGVKVYAIDIPAGILPNTGKALGSAVNADYTTSFIADKIGLHTGAGKGHAGIVINDRLQADKLSQKNSPTFLYHYQMPKPSSQTNQHKGHFGHALVMGGGQGMFGATALAAISSLKVGVGKSSIYAHPDYDSQYHIDNTALYEVMRCLDLANLSIYSTVILGPGLGRQPWGEELFQTSLKNLSSLRHCRVLIDADGLFYLANQQQDQPHIDIITPHEAEAAKLLSCDIEEIRNDKISAAKQLAEKYHCIAVLKGAGTIISDGKTCWINSTGNLNLATAGTGDVLSGMIGGYLAQGFSAQDAALYGVFKHGLAADHYAQSHTGKSLRASDIWNYL